jgi:hypothetical protein
MTSGYRSEPRVAPLAASIRAELLARPDCPVYLLEDRFEHALNAWSRAEAVVLLLSQWLDTVGVESAAAELLEGEETQSLAAGGTGTRKTRQRRVQPVLDALARWEGRAAQLRGKLGLDPVSRAALARDLGLVQAQRDDAIEDMGRRGAELVARRRAEMAARKAAELPSAGPADC